MISQHKQIGLIFVIVLVSYLHFSDLKWIRYEFAKFQQFSRFQITRQILFIPNRFLTLAIDMWGRAESAATHTEDWVKRTDRWATDLVNATYALTESKSMTGPGSSPPARQGTTAVAPYCFPWRTSRLKRTGSTQRTLWWRGPQGKVTRAMSTTTYCGGAPWPDHDTTLQAIKGCKEELPRFVGSPWCYWTARWGLWWSEMGTSSRIPMNTGERERPK
jgi:hypothetical protein